MLKGLYKILVKEAQRKQAYQIAGDVFEKYLQANNVKVRSIDVVYKYPGILKQPFYDKANLFCLVCRIKKLNLLTFYI